MSASVARLAVSSPDPCALPALPHVALLQCKPKGGRRLSFAQFLTALSLVADRKGSTLEHVATMVLATGGPVAHATKAESVRLHDDKVFVHAAH
jgi:hypothetical protein